MGSIPVRLWSSALVILFTQKVCRILLRHLFWNTSSMWLSTLLLIMRIFVFLLIIFVFHMFFRAANAFLALLILVLNSAPVFPYFVTLAPRYVNYVKTSMSWSPRLTGSAVWQLFRIVLVFLCWHEVQLSLHFWPVSQFYFVCICGCVQADICHLQSLDLLVILWMSIWSRFLRLCLFSS